jgi:cytochrome c-type biogenesis protein CcmE
MKKQPELSIEELNKSKTKLKSAVAAFMILGLFMLFMLFFLKQNLFYLFP